MIYDVDYFIKKYKSIPEEKWCIESRLTEDGRRCAHGHCYIGEADFLAQNKEENALIEIAENYKSITGGVGFATINNGWDEKYKQPTPKQRILAALYDIKKLQEGKEGKVKTIIKYVAVDADIRKEAKELVVNSIDN